MSGKDREPWRLSADEDKSFERIVMAELARLPASEWGRGRGNYFCRAADLTIHIARGRAKAAQSGAHGIELARNDHRRLLDEVAGRGAKVPDLSTIERIAIDAIELCARRGEAPPRRLVKLLKALFRPQPRARTRRPVGLATAVEFQTQNPDASRRAVAKAAGVDPKTVKAWNRGDADFRREMDNARSASKVVDGEDEVIKRLAAPPAVPPERPRRMVPDPQPNFVVTSNFERGGKVFLAGDEILSADQPTWSKQLFRRLCQTGKLRRRMVSVPLT